MSNLSDLLPAGASAKQITATDSGSGIASKAPVVMSASGTVSSVSETSSSNSAATASQYNAAVLFYQGSMVYDPDTQRVVLAYVDTNNSYYASIVVGEASASGVTWGTPVTVYSGQTVNFIAACYDTTNDRVGVAYNRYGGGAWYAGYSINGATNTPTSIASHVRFSTGNEYYIDLAYHPGENVIVSVSTNLAYSPNRGKVSVARLGASSITLGNEEFFDTYGASVYPQAQAPYNLLYESNIAELVVNFADASNSGYLMTCVISPAGTGSATFGAYSVYVSEQSYNNTLTFDENSGKLLYTYRRSSTSPTFRGAAKVGLASGTSVTVDATENYFTSTGQAREQDAAYDATAKKIGLVYYIYSSGSETRFVDATTSASDYSVTFGTDVAAYTAATTGAAGAGMMAYDTALGKLVWAFNNATTSVSQINILTLANTTTNLTAQAFVGVADSAISASAAGSIIVQGGTVSGVNAGQSVSVGSEVVYEAARANYGFPIFDSSNNKVVIIYSDNGDSDYGKAIVGTVSGSSISYGTPVNFNAATTTRPSGTFDSNSNKVVIVYQDGGDSNKTKAIVGTVSGTSISFGAEATISANVAGKETTTTFDSNLNKVVAFYRDDSNSEYGTAAVGTVSGTSITFGTPVVFESASSNFYQASSCFDTSNNKTVLVYADAGNSSHGTTIVGTVSGTSISFGTAVVFHAAETDNSVCDFDSENNKVVVAYRDNAAPKNVDSLVGTVSGTSISFGSVTSVQSLTSYISYSSIAYSPDVNKVVLVYMDAGNSEYGTYAVGEVSGTSITYETPVVFAAASTEDCGIVYDTNVDKFVISFKDTANSNYGTSVVLTFSPIPLTTGTKYFVTPTGGFSSTAGTPSVNAGLAISTTSLLLNGDS